MKNILLKVLFAAILVSSCGEERIKVACVGDGLTWGASVPNREKNSYPAQLQEYLGSGYEVRNFGTCDTAVVPGTYALTEEYSASLEYGPDVVLMVSDGRDDEGTDALAEAYRNIPSEPLVYRLTLQEVFGDERSDALFPDGVHPSSIGAGMIAEKFYSDFFAPAVWNPCVLPVPGNEFRHEAGWTEGSEWHSVAEDICVTLEGKSLELLLLGDSITQGFGGNRRAVTGRKGKTAMDEALGEGLWESAGISGDKTQNLLWRLKTGNYGRCNPRNAVITIGINNVLAGNAPQEIAEGVISCAREAVRQLPDTRIILFGPLPAGLEKDSDRRRACEEIHRILADSEIEGVEYVNPAAWFINPDGTMKTEFYSRDHLHLSRAGYEMWSKEIVAILK